MRRLMLAARAMVLIGLGTAAMVHPGPAVAASDADDATRLVTSLHASVSGILKNPDQVAARKEFRGILGRYFAVDAIGDRLIRRWQAQITPEQKAAYDGMIARFIINSYSAHVFQYADATLKVLRTTPAPDSGYNVASQLQKPGARPLAALWSVVKTDKGLKISNLVVANINLSVIQAQEFDSVIQRKGFDTLLAMMKSRV